MTEEARRRDKLIGVFILAVILFNPPVLDLFGGGSLFGWPLLYIYIFAAWIAIVVLAALVIERRRHSGHRTQVED